MGASFECEATYPRSTKICSRNVIPIESPAIAIPLFARGDVAAGDNSAIVELVNILHAKAQRQIGWWGHWRHRIERFGQSWPMMPLHFRTAGSDVLAKSGRGWNKNVSF